MKNLAINLIPILLIWGCNSPKRTAEKSESVASDTTLILDSMTMETLQVSDEEPDKTTLDTLQSKLSFYDFLSRIGKSEDVSSYINKEYYGLWNVPDLINLFSNDDFAVLWMHEGMEEWNIATVYVYSANGEQKSVCAVPWTNEIVSGSEFQFNYDTISTDPLKLALSIDVKYYSENESGVFEKDYNMTGEISVTENQQCLFRILKESGLD